MRYISLESRGGLIANSYAWQPLRNADSTSIQLETYEFAANCERKEGRKAVCCGRRLAHYHSTLRARPAARPPQGAQSILGSHLPKVKHPSMPQMTERILAWHARRSSPLRRKEGHTRMANARSQSVSQSEERAPHSQKEAKVSSPRSERKEGRAVNLHLAAEERARAVSSLRLCKFREIYNDGSTDGTRGRGQGGRGVPVWWRRLEDYRH